MCIYMFQYNKSFKKGSLLDRANLIIGYIVSDYSFGWRNSKSYYLFSACDQVHQVG